MYVSTVLFSGVGYWFSYLCAFCVNLVKLHQSPSLQLPLLTILIRVHVNCADMDYDSFGMYVNTIQFSNLQ